MSQTISSQLDAIRSTLIPDVELVAVSKYHTAAEIMEAYQAGQRIFGESRVQDLCTKHDTLPKDISWHFIGHLQTNKVKFIVPFIEMIHAVDSEKLLLEIDAQAQKVNRVIPCLLQLHVAQEETKFGFSPEECAQFLKTYKDFPWKGIQIAGIMGMASNVDNECQIHQEFKQLHDFFVWAKQQYFSQNESFRFRSWGMSSDYRIAMQEGCNMVRIGSSIFNI